jgi:3-hydroxyisobutyrate dehydrogenase-like beta-hydroxyacid dehydrogenase
MQNVGIIGIGQMGMPMARNLLRSKYRLTIYARRKSKAKPLEKLGANLVESPRLLAASSDVVLLSLPSPEVVREVVLGNDGVAFGLKRGGVVIDTSTIDPKTGTEISLKMKRRRLHYLDSPVSGGPEGAERATLTFMVGGEREVFEQCRSIFEALGKNVFYLGQSGSGQGTKLINQLLVASNTLSSAEAVQLAQALKLDLRKVIDVIKVSAGDSFIFRRVADRMSKRQFGSGWQTYLLQKDIGLILDICSKYHLPAVSASSAFGVFSESLEVGLGKVDSASVIKILEKQRRETS